MTEDKPVPVSFPERGMDISGSHSEQAGLTTPDAQNVTVHDTFADRARGGSRPGLSKYISIRLPL